MLPNEIKKFDNDESVQLGRPKFFDPDHYLDSVEQMLSADEVMFAIEMIKRMPGYYRDHPTERQSKLLSHIYQNMASLTYYVNAKFETYEEALFQQSRLNPGFAWADKGLGAMIDIPFCQPRGGYMVSLVKAMNEDGRKPFIWEMGANSFWLPYGLEAKGLDFNYYSKSLQPEAQRDAEARIESWGIYPKDKQTQIFCCFEVIEHLQNPYDILQTYHEYGADADHIIISTPKYTLFGGVSDKNRILEHIRTFTPKELNDICTDMWPTHTWQMINYPMMVFIGERKGILK